MHAPEENGTDMDADGVRSRRWPSGALAKLRGRFLDLS